MLASLLPADVLAEIEEAAKQAAADRTAAAAAAAGPTNYDSHAIAPALLRIFSPQPCTLGWPDCLQKHNRYSSFSLCGGAVIVSLPAAVVDEAEIEEAAAAKQVAADRAAAAAAGPTRVVHLTRPPEIEEVRRQLPIIGLEQEIMEGINHNDVVVSAGLCDLSVGAYCFSRSRAVTPAPLGPNLSVW